MQSEGDMVFSGMQFRDFGNDNCFRIEDSNFYKKSLQHMGYKTVEFVTYKRENGNGEGSLYFVEAKTSLRPMSNEPRAVDEISDISQKFIDALQIVCGSWHGARQNKVSLPANFHEFKVDGSKIVFVLVVKNIENKNLLWVAEAIKGQLKREFRLWKFAIKVLSEEMAIEEKLVVSGEV